MAEERMVYLVDTQYGSRVKVYQITKETAKMFKVKGLTYGTWESQLLKDDNRIRFSLDEARKLLRERLVARVDARRKLLQEAEDLLAHVDTFEPEWRK